MNYRHIVFDIDGTLVDTKECVLRSFQKTMRELTGTVYELETLSFALGITGKAALLRMQIAEDQLDEVLEQWNRNMDGFRDSVSLFEGIVPLIKALHAAGFRLGLVTSETYEEYRETFLLFGLDGYFQTVVCADDTTEHKPTAAPLLKYMEKAGCKPEEVLYIGDSSYDRQCAQNAQAAFVLAGWGAADALKKELQGACLEKPEDLFGVLFSQKEEPQMYRWLKRAMELQFIAQAGLTYSKDKYDIERFQRIREMSAEIMQDYTDYGIEKINSVFCSETGFQTPKIDTRAAVFEDGKILLVEENGLWALPGGWVDVNQSVADNAVKETKEEAGLDVEPVLVIAVQDRNRHNFPLFAYGICKIFFLCKKIGGSFVENLETTDSRYFGIDELPDLCVDKTTEEQIRMCFAANESENWKTLFE